MDSCARALSETPIKSFLLGMVAWLFFYILFVLLAAVNLGLIGLILMGFVIYRELFGYTAIYQRVGERLSSDPIVPDGMPGWRMAFRGGLMIETATLIPIAGWMVKFVLNCQALGAVLLAGEFFRLKLHRPVAEVPSSPAPPSPPSDQQITAHE